MGDPPKTSDQKTKHWQLADLIDLDRVQRVMKRFCDVVGVSMTVADESDDCLTTAGWDPVCTRFHQSIPSAACRCKNSGSEIAGKVRAAKKMVQQSCANGLWTCVWPIEVDGQVLGTLWAGQFFLQAPDEEKFCRQAAEFGFDEQAYLAAVRQVPVLSRHSLEALIAFVTEFAQLWADLGLRRKREFEASARLESSEQRYGTLADAIPEMIYITDRGGRVKYANSAAAQMFKRTPGELIGCAQSDLFPPASAERHQRALTQVFDSGKPVLNRKIQEISADGPIWIDAFLVPLQDKSGRVNAVMGISRDISEQVASEEILRRNEEQYRTLSENTQDYIARFNSKTQFIYLNRALTEALQLKLDAVLGKTPFELATASPRSKTFEDQVQAVFKTGKPVRDEMDMQFAADEKVLVDYRLLPELDSSGKVSTVLAVGRDIAELKRAQAAMIRSQQLAAVGTLAGGIAHEFNNIHMIIQSQLEHLLQDDNLKADAREEISNIRLAVQRASTVTKNVLAFARQTNSERCRVSLGDVIEQTANMVQGEYASEGIELDVCIDGDPTFVFDPAQISQVLLNLVINARHAVLASLVKRIEIHAGVKKDRAFLKVRDTGCGIPPEDIDKVILPFFTTKGEHAPSGSPLAKVRGSGLGLSVCDTLVKQHGGDLVIESQEGLGTSVTVWFPLNEPHQDPGSTEDLAPPATKKRARLLIVDDEPLILDMFQRYFKRVGHSIKATDDGELGLKTILDAQPPIDVVIVDIQMPKMNGIEFLQRLHRLPLEVPPAVLVATGRLGEENPDELGNLGVFGILRKPFEMKTILRMVDQAVQYRREAGQRMPF